MGNTRRRIGENRVSGSEYGKSGSMLISLTCVACLLSLYQTSPVSTYMFSMEALTSICQLSSQCRTRHFGMSCMHGCGLDGNASIIDWCIDLDI
jgi:hypothetical protein